MGLLNWSTPPTACWLQSLGPQGSPGRRELQQPMIQIHPLFFAAIKNFILNFIWCSMLKYSESFRQNFYPKIFFFISNAGIYVKRTVKEINQAISTQWGTG